MAQRTLESTKLYIEVENGTDASGNPVYAKQSLFSLVKNANADAVVELCEQIKPLLARSANRNIKTELSRVDGY